MRDEINTSNAAVRIWNMILITDSSIRQAIIGKTRFKYKNWQTLSTWYLDFSSHNGENNQNKLFWYKSTSIEIDVSHR